MTGETRSPLQESIVVTTPVADLATASAAGLDHGRLKKRQDREKAAEKLRKAGWSYRRIAEALAVPYIMIGRWLSGESEPPPPPAPAAGDPIPAPPPIREPAAIASSAKPPAAAGDDDPEPGHRLTVLGLQFTAFEGYVRDVIGRFEADRKDMARRHTAALDQMETGRAAAEAARAAAEQEVKAMRAEIDALRAELETFREEVHQDLARGGGRAAAGGDDRDDGDDGDEDFLKSPDDDDAGEDGDDEDFNFDDPDEPPAGPAMPRRR